MEFKIVKTTSSEFQKLYSFYLKEMTIEGYYDKSKSFYDKLQDKYAIMLYEDNCAFAFISYKYDIFNVYVSHMYINPVKRESGFEEILIKALENTYNKVINIVVRLSDIYLIKVLKDFNYIRISSNVNKNYFDVFKKDDSYHYTKIIINIETLYDTNKKLILALKKILKLYNIKTSKENLNSFKQSVISIDKKYLQGDLSQEEYDAKKFQTYLNNYGIKCDSLLCKRIYENSKMKPKDFCKTFFRLCGKHKRIFVLSELDQAYTQDILKNLKLKHISEVYLQKIEKDGIQKIIKSNKYKNKMEFCYIDNKNISDDILRLGIDSYKISSKLDDTSSFLFRKEANNFKELAKIIIKK